MQFSDEAQLGIGWFDDKHYRCLAGLHARGYVENNNVGGWSISKKGWGYINRLKRELGHC